MAIRTIETSVEVDLGDFEDDELVDELEARGYTVVKSADSGDQRSAILDDAAWRLSRGDVDDALHILARTLGPQFRDLPELVRKRMN
ncbi:hypothetical protein [Microvirga mediterraneensis]|uniref:Uncharacterized protein n=1 Tax=Microvirga mediterraneensis TaxID=2754695 RepID=A0A838BPS5_9HYPH|nr:hypothetical protein [Microvirga mediterraneensis]MBA1156902.1 hypothetical protein [Microvirga mediterraneensis]